MKRKLFVILTAILSALCLCCAAGCFIIKTPEENTNPTQPNPPSDTQIQPPSSARLDSVSNVLYVSDCFDSGVGYYETFQKQGAQNKKIGECARSEKAESGYVAIDIPTVIYNNPTELTVMCYAGKNDRAGKSRKFTFEYGGKIIFDVQHCSYDKTTGLVTWTAVDGATGYAVKTGNTSPVTVTEPGFPVSGSVTELYVAPLFEGYKFGLPEKIELENKAYAHVNYDTEKQAFVFDIEGDSFEITVAENGKSVTETTEKGEFAYTPVSQSVTLSITAYHSFYRPRTEVRTFSVLTAPAGIKIDKSTGVLSWGSVQNAEGYGVTLKMQDGSVISRQMSAAEIPLAQTDAEGAVTAIIKPLTADKNTAVLQSEPFDFLMVRGVYALSPQIFRNTDSGKLHIGLTAEEKYVSGYDVTVTNTHAEQTVRLNCADASDGKLSAEMNLPVFDLTEIKISRCFNATEGHICFDDLSATAEYRKTVVYTGAPQVVMKDKNATLHTGTAEKRAFTVEVKFPAELKEIGKQLLIEYKYGNNSEPVAKHIDADYALSLAAQAGQTDLEVRFKAFMSSNYVWTEVFSDSFKTAVTCLSGVGFSADGEKISWRSVEYAQSYRVERAEAGAYSEVYCGGNTFYSHGITEAGSYEYRITPFNDGEPFVLEGDPVYCYIEKLEKPSIAMNADGTVSVTAACPSDSAVAFIDGKEVNLSTETLREALTGKTQITLSARSVRENTATHTYIDSDDAQIYTVHRIAEVNGENMGLETDSAANKVKWAAVGGAADYRCRLYYREPSGGTYATEKEFISDVCETDASQFVAGWYKLEITPISYCADSEIYLYFDGAAEGEFRKDGVISVTPSGDGLGVRLNNFIALPDVSVTLSYRGRNYTAALSDKLNILEYDGLKDDLDSAWQGTDYISFDVNYGDGYEERLNSAKAFKADSYSFTLKICNSVTPQATGRYELTDSPDNSSANHAKVTLTPLNGLKSFESYRLTRLVKDADKHDSYAQEKSRVDGTEMEVDFNENGVTNLFMLTAVSDKFTVENGQAAYYRSSGSICYRATVQPTFNGATVTDILTGYSENELKSKYVSFTLNFGNVYKPDLTEAYIEYLSTDGEWSQWYTSEDKNRHKLNGGDTIVKELSGNVGINEGDAVKLRIKRCNGVLDGVTFDESCWYYLSFTVPAYPQT